MILCQKLKGKQKEERNLGKARVNQERKRRKQDLKANQEQRRKQNLRENQNFVLKQEGQLEEVLVPQNAKLARA